MQTVLIVLFDGVQALDVTGPLEVLDGANRWRTHHHARPAYEVRTASLGGHLVRTSSGLHLAPDSDLRQIGPPDRAAPEMLIVPGGAGSRRADPDLVAWLRAHGGRAQTARRRLEDTADGVEETARSCGYGTPEAMRRAFIRALGVSPGEYRRRFHPARVDEETKERHADRHPAL
jgi:transcriptional regulator GlxA family with amidase domain